MERDSAEISTQFRFDEKYNILKFQPSTRSATRQFQMAFLYAKLSAPEVIDL